MTTEQLLKMDLESAWDAVDQLVETDPLALRDLAFALLRDLRAAKKEGASR